MLAVHWNVGEVHVYTLTVATDHDFFVGAADVLVHNAFCHKIAGSVNFEHSLDRHFADWFAREPRKGNPADVQAWTALLERATQSTKIVPWKTGGDGTVGYFARIDGKPLLVEFFATGEHVGELATAIVPNQTQLTLIYQLLKDNR